MSTLPRAIEIAHEAHAGQVDKAGAPYIAHPLRVMARVSTVEERIVAVLHDVVEDCASKGWTLERLRDHERFSAAVIEALAAVTHEPIGSDEEAAYFQAIRRAAANPIARNVKRADLQDNADLSRIAQPTERDRRRVEKYKRALQMLDESE